MEDKNPVQVAGRLFGALEYLAYNGPSGLMEIAEALSLNKSTVHRAVSSLQYMGYVRQDQESGKYETTFKIVDMANHVMEKMDIVQTVRPYLRKLSDACGETVHFVRMEEADVVYIDKVESFNNNVRMVSHVGSRIPFYRSAVGKALAAKMPQEEVRRLWDSCSIERMTPYTITNFEEFLENLEEIRHKGYALDNEENETGVRCIAAALDFREGEYGYAFSISVPISRMDNDRIRELAADVLRVREEIDREFSGR